MKIFVLLISSIALLYGVFATHHYINNWTMIPTIIVLVVALTYHVILIVFHVLGALTKERTGNG